MKLLFCSLLAVSLTFSSREAIRLSETEMVVLLCPFDQLVLTCMSNTTFLHWRIMDTYGAFDTRRVANDVSSSPSLTVGTTEFRFSLNSPPSTLPHISQIQADRVANGTVITCSASWNNKKTITICLIGSGCDPPIFAPEFTIIEQRESSDRVVTTVEWIPNNLLSYNVSVFPEVPLVFTERTSVQLTIPYNIQLMVNVSAILCGETAMTTVKNFFYMYTTCGYPLREESLNDSIQIKGYNISELAKSGTIISFSCLNSKLVLTGPNSSTCMWNGQWQPDPSEVECKVNCGIPSSIDNNFYFHNGTLEGSQVVYEIKCNNETVSLESECQSNGSWTPDPSEYVCRFTPPESSVLNFTTIIILVSSTSILGCFFIILSIFGLLYGQFKWNRRKPVSQQPVNQKSEDKKSVAENICLSSGPIYEDLLTVMEYEKSDIELKSNVSYGPHPMIDKIKL